MLLIFIGHAENKQEDRLAGLVQWGSQKLLINEIESQITKIWCGKLLTLKG